MLVEGLGNITFVNGLLRIQALTVNTDGKLSGQEQLKFQE